MLWVLSSLSAQLGSWKNDAPPERRECPTGTCSEVFGIVVGMQHLFSTKSRNKLAIGLWRVEMQEKV